MLENRKQIDGVKHEKEELVKRQEYEKAAMLRDKKIKLEQMLREEKSVERE
ncbi:MAG: UvrB/UvrC motif-containing protein [bacterium]|nr:UvrB/UvrC motif-containing protein [bacterium]